MKKILFSLVLAGVVVLSFALLNSGHTQLVASEQNTIGGRNTHSIDGQEGDDAGTGEGRETDGGLRPAVGRGQRILDDGQVRRSRVQNAHAEGRAGEANGSDYHQEKALR